MAPATATTTTVPSTPKSALLTDAQQDVPIFLRKTFHMVDTCDSSIACWSDDGETFIVKDPVKFEKQIIPQFFKHSKFTSFVRQLNFYAFRKIKYADTIRIDPKLEAETANYWRFRHEKFQRGHPELLSEIKRMNGQKSSQPTASTDAKGSAAASPRSAQADQENSKLKSEVSSLKEKLEAMTKNIDELTSMVQKVTLATRVPPEDQPANDNHKKRAKVQEADYFLEAPHSVPVMPSPDLAPSHATSMELDALPLPPSIPSPLPMDDASRPTSTGTELTDEGFVDQLFTAFKTEDLMEMPEPTPSSDNHNRPRPELMNRLSDALSALPRDIQELIVDRLIQAITSPVKTTVEEETAAPTVQDENRNDNLKDPQQVANLQLAAATLSAILGQCSGETNKSTNNNHNKALLIPVHA